MTDDLARLLARAAEDLPDTPGRYQLVQDRRRQRARRQRLLAGTAALAVAGTAALLAATVPGRGEVLISAPATAPVGVVPSASATAAATGAPQVASAPVPVPVRGRYRLVAPSILAVEVAVGGGCTVVPAVGSATWVETADEVVITAYRQDRAQPGRPAGADAAQWNCPADLVIDEVVVTLATPLGRRVVRDATSGELLSR